jgi:hypothetical protein
MGAPSQSDRKLYPEGELTQAPLATPLSGPKIVQSNADLERGVDRKLSCVDEIYPSTATNRRKHESYTLSGSVFLIAGNGQTVKLPAPSDSPADPLSWGRWKRAGVFLAVSWFSIVALAVAQAGGLFLGVISRDFKVDVCYKTVPLQHKLIGGQRTFYHGRWTL